MVKTHIIERANKNKRESKIGDYKSIVPWRSWDVVKREVGLRDVGTGGSRKRDWEWERAVVGRRTRAVDAIIAAAEDAILAVDQISLLLLFSSSSFSSGLTRERGNGSRIFTCVSHVITLSFLRMPRGYNVPSDWFSKYQKSTTRCWLLRLSFWLPSKRVGFGSMLYLGPNKSSMVGILLFRWP